ncbi:MAG: LysR family transcriptional regulator [Lachnospiraceae bacterium]|nr:LysR family transcriptional regulator [Lachnospiraceae bacterium]
MNITELKYVVKTAEVGSISAAAKSLYVAQPNISKAIKSLEEEYGIQLFERFAKGVVPTREGQKFIQQAERIIGEIGKLDGQFRQPLHQQVELKISIPRASYASNAFVQYVRKIKNRDKVKVHIKECNSLEALNHIIRNQYHLSLIRFETQYEEYYQSIIRLKHLEYETLMEFQYYLLVGQDSPLAAKEIGGYEDLEGYIELIHGDTRLPNGDYVDMMEIPENTNSRKRIHVYERGSQFDLLQGIPETYMWVSPMPQETLERYHLIQKECSWQKRTIKDVLVCPNHRLLREEDQDFIEELKKEISRVSGHQS